MSFVLTENCRVDIWVRPAAPPWVTGDPPNMAAVPMQKIRSWLAIDGNQVAGLEAGGIGIHRFIWGSDPHPTAGWTEVTGDHTYFGVHDQFDPMTYYCVMAVDHWFDADDIVYNQAWATMQWDGN